MSEIQIALEDYVRMLKAEIIRLNNQSYRLRAAMAKAAQRAEGWPDSNDDPAQVLSDVADILYDALDVRFLRPDPLSQALNEGYERRRTGRLTKVGRARADIQVSKREAG